MLVVVQRMVLEMAESKSPHNAFPVQLLTWSVGLSRSAGCAPLKAPYSFTPLPPTEIQTITLHLVIWAFAFVVSFTKVLE